MDKLVGSTAEPARKKRSGSANRTPFPRVTDARRVRTCAQAPGLRLADANGLLAMMRSVKNTRSHTSASPTVRGFEVGELRTRIKAMGALLIASGFYNGSNLLPGVPRSRSARSAASAQRSAGRTAGTAASRFENLNLRHEASHAGPAERWVESVQADRTWTAVPDAISSAPAIRGGKISGSACSLCARRRGGPCRGRSLDVRSRSCRSILSDCRWTVRRAVAKSRKGARLGRAARSRRRPGRPQTAIEASRRAVAPVERRVDVRQVVANDGGEVVGDRHLGRPRILWSAPGASVHWPCQPNFTTGRTSMDPWRADGIFAAMERASSRSLASTM
jgi:hypothetical protein